MAKVGLFVSCIVDSMRPSIGFAAAKLIEQSGYSVVVPQQSCCGQIAYNSGDKRTTCRIARQVIAAFENVDYIVVPSGSCAGMLKKHYTQVLRDFLDDYKQAQIFSAKVYELSCFLVDVAGFDKIDAQCTKSATYHDSCSGLRELGIKNQPRQLLSKVKGLELVEMPDAEICCGFGGLFSVKYGEISNAIVEKKAKHVLNQSVDMVLAGDLGCLLNMAGKLSRMEKREIEVRHYAEVLAGMTDIPAIAAPRASFV